VALSLAGCRPSAAAFEKSYDRASKEMKLGDLPGALTDADASISRLREQQSEWAWRFRTLKAEIFLRQGRYADSLALLDGEFPAKLAGSEIEVWRELTLGAANAYLERYPIAAQHLQRAQQLAEANHPALLPEVYLRRGTLASLQYDYAAATALYHCTLDLARQQEDPFLEIAALGSLGLEASRVEHFDESIDWNDLALRLAQSIGDLRSVSRIEGNQGWSYYKMGDLSNALDEFQKAESDANRTGLVADADFWLINAASVSYDSGNFAQAEADGQRALKLAKNLNDRSATIGCMQLLALVSMAHDHLPAADQFLREAQDLENSSPDEQREIYTRLILAQYSARKEDFAQAENLFASLSQNAKSPMSVRWESQAGLAQVHARQGKNALAEKEFRESTETIHEARDALHHEDFRLSFLSSAIRFYDAYVDFLIDQNRPIDALRIADLSRAQTLEEGLPWQSVQKKNSKARTFDPPGIARRLNATLLFYWLGNSRSYLWAVTPSKTSLVALTTTDLDASVRSYRQSFLEPQDPLEAGNLAGKKLYAQLIQPAEQWLPKNSRVVVLPDGSLNTLNLETLIVSGRKPEDQAHYWIDDVTITTANSLALLARSSVTQLPNPGRLLVVGDALAASPDFPPLPEAGKEVGLLENYFTSSQRLELTGANATATRFLSSHPEKFSYLHFATHGTASRIRPLESAVILSREGDSFKLYARDVVNHPLGAFLVTISACNGAGQKSYAGEGLVGLSWAFLRAGAHHVIAGLWEVSNASTPQLMDELYKGLRAGQDPATALRSAKLKLVHSRGIYRKPFYWAPFLLYAGS